MLILAKVSIAFFFRFIQNISYSSSTSPYHHKKLLGPFSHLFGSWEYISPRTRKKTQHYWHNRWKSTENQIVWRSITVCSIILKSMLKEVSIFIKWSNWLQKHFLEAVENLFIWKELCIKQTQKQLSRIIQRISCSKFS